MLTPRLLTLITNIAQPGARARRSDDAVGYQKWQTLASNYLLKINFDSGRNVQPQRFENAANRVLGFRVNA